MEVMLGTYFADLSLADVYQTGFSEHEDNKHIFLIPVFNPTALCNLIGVECFELFPSFRFANQHGHILQPCHFGDTVLIFLIPPALIQFTQLVEDSLSFATFIQMIIANNTSTSLIGCVLRMLLVAMLQALGSAIPFLA